MKEIRRLVPIAAAQIVVLLPVGLLDPMKFASNGWHQRSFAIAIVLGCGFAQASVAAAWMALGPLALPARAVAATLSVLLSALLLLINITFSGPGGSMFEGLFLGGSFVGVWLFVQANLWCAIVAYRLRLDAPHRVSAETTAGEHQFGIRQLLIVTAAVAVTLGFGRLMILKLRPDQSPVDLGGRTIEMFFIAALFVICNSLVAFTVITGALLFRQWLFAVAIGMCAAAIVTLVEWDLFRQLAAGPDWIEALVIVGGMNGVQFTWLLFTLLAVRAAGYRLRSAANESSAASTF